MHNRDPGLLDKLLLNDDNRRPAKQSVCVACVFFTFRLILSIIKSASDFDLMLLLSDIWLSMLSWKCTFSWPPYGWCAVASIDDVSWIIELRAFLPPIKRSWLLVVLNRDTGRSTVKSSKDVNVCERANETCFVLFNEHGAWNGVEKIERGRKIRMKIC